MRYRLLLPSLLTLSALGLAACGEETTQPNTGGESTDRPAACRGFEHVAHPARNMPLDLVYRPNLVPATSKQPGRPSTGKIEGQEARKHNLPLGNPDGQVQASGHQ